MTIQKIITLYRMIAYINDHIKYDDRITLWFSIWEIFNFGFEKYYNSTLAVYVVFKRKYQ